MMPDGTYHYGEQVGRKTVCSLILMKLFELLRADDENGTCHSTIQFVRRDLLNPCSLFSRLFEEEIFGAKYCFKI